MQWTAGIIALGDGWLLPLHRFFLPPLYEAGEDEPVTEVFYFEEGRHAGSVVLGGMWTLLDYDPARGVLMATAEPVPHFVRVPASALISRHRPR